MVKIQPPKLVIGLQSKYSFLCPECYIYLHMYFNSPFPQKAFFAGSQKTQHHSQFTLINILIPLSVHYLFTAFSPVRLCSPHIPQQENTFFHRPSGMERESAFNFNIIFHVYCQSFFCAFNYIFNVSSFSFHLLLMFQPQ